MQRKETCMNFVGYEKFIVKAPKSYLIFFLTLLKALEKCQPQSLEQIFEYWIFIQISMTKKNQNSIAPTF